MDPLLTDTPDPNVGFQSFLNKHVKGIPDKQEVAPAPPVQEEYVPKDVAFAATPTEPQQVDQPLLQDFVKNIDPRTAVPVGTYTEEEIQGAAAEEVAASIIKQNVPALSGFDAETLKLLVEKDPKAGVHNDLVSIAKTHAAYMYKMQKASEAAMAVKSPSDVEALNRAIGLYDEAILERQKVPMEYPERGLVHEIIRNTSEQVGLLGRMAYSAEDDILKGATVGLLAGAATANPAAALFGTVRGAGLGAGKGMIDGGFIASRGEILFSLIHPNQPKLTDKYGLTSGVIPLDVALPLADKYGAIAGSLEAVELRLELMSAGLLTPVIKRILALGSEYGTEATQQIIGMYARFEADKIMAERNGETFDQSFDTRLDWYEANQAGRAAMLGAFGMSVPSMTYQGGRAIAMSHPIETLQALSNSKNLADQEAIAAAESVRAAMQENVLNNPPAVPVVDADEEATNELVSGDPLSFNEVNANRPAVNVRGTDITIADLDDLTVSADDTQLEEALDTLETKVESSLSDRTAVFLSGLYDFYSVEEADSFEQLLTGRANATGMSLSDYIDFRGLELTVSEETSDQYKGYADITNEHNVIINLFQNADISTIVHEAGHVFSLDLKGDDKVIIEEFLGVERGTVWGVVEQEKWAKAWETYVGEGKAPSPKMDSIFKKFAHWLATIYGSVKNLGVDITPEVRGVFDRMLTTDKRNELATNTLVTEQINEVMNSGEVIRNEATATTTATPEASQTAQDVIINDGIRNEATATTTATPESSVSVEDVIRDAQFRNDLPDVQYIPIEMDLDQFLKNNRPKKPRAPRKKKEARATEVEKTPTEVLYDALVKANDVSEALKHILKTSTNPLYQAIAKRLIPLTKGAGLLVVEPGVSYGIPLPAKLQSAVGVCRTKIASGESFVFLRGTGFTSHGIDEETVLHEAIHVATNMLISYTNKPAVKRLTALYDHAKAQINEQINVNGLWMYSDELRNSIGYMMSSRDEFIAYGMSNPEFQELLRTIAFDSTKSVFTKFVEGIRELLGLYTSESSVLSELIDVSDRLFAARSKVVKGASARTTTSQKLDTAAEISNSKEELVENILTLHYQEKIKADREAFERVEQMQEEEATVLYQNVQVRYGERIEDTDEADIARADKLDAYMNRVGKEYGIEVGAIKRRKLSEKQTWRLQKLALAKVMQRMFDAGDKHGYAMARAAMKALLARERARYVLYNKHKALRQSFQEKLKKGFPQKEGGKNVLKMDPAAALFLQTVSRLLEAAQTFKGVRAMYEKLKLGYPVGYLPSQEEVLANKFVEAAAIRSISSLDKLKQLNADLADFINDARSDSPANKRKAQKEKDVEDILTEIRGSRDVMGIEHTDTVTETSRLRETLNKGKTKAQRLATSILGHEVFGSFISNIQNVTAYAGRVHGKFYKICDFFDAKHAKTSDIRRIQDNFINKTIEIYNLKGRYSAYQMWKEHNKRQFDVTGLGDLYSRSELKYLWLLWQDKTITNRLVNMHITEEVMAKVDNLLTQEDKAMAEYTKAFFNSDEVYNKVNGVHVRVYGAALNRVKDYVPLTVEGVVNEMEEFAGQLMVSQFQMDALARSSDTRRTPQSTGHIKNRTDSKHPIVIRSLESAFSSYVSEIFHFVHFAEQAQRVAAILKDTRIRRAIEIEYDSKILGTIDEQFKNVIADGANLRNMYNTLDKFRSAWIQSKLGLAVPVFLKQNISQLQMLAEYDITVLPFIKNYMKFFNPAKVKGNFQELFNSEYYKNRRTSNDRDITAVISAGAFEEYSLNPTITNFFMLPVLLGDSVANSVSGWVAVECLVEQGVPRQTAVKRVAKIVERSMQSSHMQEQTVYQTGGTFARFMTTFSSGPIQMARKEVQAIKDYAAGKIGKSQLAKVFFINHLLVPALYGIVSDILTGSEEDDRDKLIKYGIIMALGPFGSTYAISDVVMSTVSAVFGIKSYAPSTFVQDTAKDIERVTKAVVQNDFDNVELHDWAAAIEGALTFMGIGVPLKRTAYIGENLAEGDVIRAAVGMRPEGN